MPVVRMEAHPEVVENKGKVAIRRGPIVYGFEGLDNDGKPFTAIPFYALANREQSNQEVWLPQEGKTENRQGWQGRLYRRWQP